jgi:hypothetical protein
VSVLAVRASKLSMQGNELVSLEVAKGDGGRHICERAVAASQI